MSTTRAFKPRELAVSITWCLLIVMLTGVTGCNEDKNDELSHRLAHDPEFARKYGKELLLQEIERASIIARTTYEVSEDNEDFCEQRIVEFWKGKELKDKLARFGEEGALALTPINKDGTVPPDSIAFFAVGEESEFVRPFAQHHIHDGKIHGGITVEEVRAAAVPQRHDRDSRQNE